MKERVTDERQKVIKIDDRQRMTQVDRWINSVINRQTEEVRVIQVN